MKQQYFFSIVEIIYFIIVIALKAGQTDQQYFYPVFSLLWSAVFVPMDILLQNYVELSQFTGQVIYYSVNIFCLGVIDLGLKEEHFLQTVQMCLLGFFVGKLYQDMYVMGNQFQNQQKVARITYLIIMICALNFSHLYLHHQSLSILGLLGSEIVIGLMLCIQIKEELQPQIILQLPLKETQRRPKKKISGQSYSERPAESPKLENTIRGKQSVNASFLGDENKMLILELSQGVKRNSHRDQMPALKDDSSVYSMQNSHRDQMNLKSNFYGTLFNQFPEGILILNEAGQIDYMNNQIHKLLGTKNKKEDILNKLYSLKNYQNKFEEQNQFYQLFRALNQKLKENSHDSIQDEFVDEDVSDQENDYETRDMGFDKGFSNADSLKEELDQLLDMDRSSYHVQRMNSIKSCNGGIVSEKIRFLQEVKMLSALKDNEEQINNEDNEIEGLLLQVTIKPYYYENKYQILLMIKDVSLFNQYKVVQQINENKTKMLDFVSHELRTPLNCINIITSELMEKYKTKDKQFTEKFLFPLKSASDQILRLANDLLDLAQLKAGKFQLSLDEFNLQKMLIDVVSLMTFTANQKKLYLKLSYDPLIPKIIKSDQHRIRQIVQNLISNALKFTQQGGIMVQANLFDNKTVEICVVDTGVGISAENINKLFTPFGKLEDSKNMNGQGVGLGLMISNIMAHKLSNIDKGLVAQSEGVNLGTKFQFYVYDHSEKTQTNKTNKTGNQSAAINFGQDSRTLDRKESNMSIVYVEPQSSTKLKLKKNIVKIGSDQKIGANGPIIFQFQQKQESKEDESLDSSDYQKKLMKYTFYSVSHTHTLKRTNNKDSNNEDLSVDCNSDPEQIEKIEEKNEDEESRVGCECPQVIFVDDDYFSVQAQVSMFSSSVRCVEALSGVQCLEILTNWNCELCKWIKVVVTDINMPGMSGIQLARMIRKIEDERQVHSYIIGLSGDNDEKVKIEGMRAGIDEFVMKPFVPETFKQLILSQVNDQ